MMNYTNQLFRYFGLNLGKRATIRQISLETKIPYMTVNRIISRLSKESIVITERVGKSLICSLNIENRLIKQYLTISSESFKNDFLKKKPLISKIAQAVEEEGSNDFCAVLFGSYAAGKEGKHSDIDISFIGKVGEDIAKEITSIEQIHDLEINTMKFTAKQFQEMLKTKEENVGKQIMKNHIILYNAELFWNVVYEVMK